MTAPVTTFVQRFKELWKIEDRDTWNDFIRSLSSWEYSKDGLPARYQLRHAIPAFKYDGKNYINGMIFANKNIALYNCKVKIKLNWE